jgi:hypothetical protein
VKLTDTHSVNKNVRLGKKEYVSDNRTLRLARFILSDVRVPVKFDFDKHKAPFPIRTWGNDTWGDCVIAGEANQLLRLERVEQRRTIPLLDSDVINRYKALTGSVSPEDANDSGLVILEAMRDWFHNGFPIAAKSRNYSIAAYGELDLMDRAQLRMASYLLHGIHIGFSLPRAAQQMTNEGVWHYEGQTGPEWHPGSWGGHLVYSKAFDPDSHEILTWGMKVKVTNEFLEKYADEAWAVVDNFDSWRVKQTVDVDGLCKQLGQITSKVNV